MACKGAEHLLYPLLTKTHTRKRKDVNQLIIWSGVDIERSLSFGTKLSTHMSCKETQKLYQPRWLKIMQKRKNGETSMGTVTTDIGQIHNIKETR